MDELLVKSIREFIFQSLIVVVPVALIYLIIRFIRSYVNTPLKYEKARKKYLILIIVFCFLLVILAVSFVIFRHDLFAAHYF